MAGLKDGMASQNLRLQDTMEIQGVTYPTPLSTTKKGAKIYYVDNSITTSGDGLSKNGPFKYLQEAITAINADYSGYGCIVYVAPGLYAEATPISITANDVKIIGTGLPEDTVIFGVTTQGTVAAADDHLFNVTGGNVLFQNLALFTYKNNKASIYFDGSGGGYGGGFCVVRNCVFSPQAADGQGYGIYNAGGASLIVEDCQFYATKTAGIWIAARPDASGYATRGIIRNNHFVGCGDAGIKVDSVVHELIIDRNIFQAGSEGSWNQTDDIVLTANMTAGSINITDNYASVAALGDFLADASAGGTVIVFDNHYTADA